MPAFLTTGFFVLALLAAAADKALGGEVCLAVPCLWFPGVEGGRFGVVKSPALRMVMPVALFNFNTNPLGTTRGREAGAEGVGLCLGAVFLGDAET